MQLTVNGTGTELPEGTTVEILVADRADPGRPVAVALNSEVVPRSTWRDTQLCDGDVVELVAAVAGG